MGAERGSIAATACVLHECSTAASRIAGRSSGRLGARILRYETVFMANLDVKNTFDVAKPSV